MPLCHCDRPPTCLSAHVTSRLSIEAQEGEGGEGGLRSHLVTDAMRLKAAASKKSASVVSDLSSSEKFSFLFIIFL